MREQPRGVRNRLPWPICPALGACSPRSRGARGCSRKVPVAYPMPLPPAGHAVDAGIEEALVRPAVGADLGGGGNTVLRSESPEGSDSGRRPAVSRNPQGGQLRRMGDGKIFVLPATAVDA
jgi:hypothetical protein